MESQDWPIRQVSVFCAEPSHAKSVYVVQTYVLTFRDGFGREVEEAEDEPFIDLKTGEVRFASEVHHFWAPTKRLDITDERGGEKTLKLAAQSARASLVGDRYVSRAQSRANPEIFDGGSRHRYNFRCKTCGFGRAWKGDAVDAVFDKLAAAGVPSISIMGLAGILK